MQGGNLVIEVVPTLIKTPCIEGQGVLYELCINPLNTSGTSSRFALFKQVQEPSCITVCIPNNGIYSLVFKLQTTKSFFLCSLKQQLQFFVCQRLQYVDLSP